MGRVADDDGVGRYVASHYGARANDGVFTNGDPGKDYRAGTDHHVVVKRDEPAQRCARRDMNTVSDVAFVVHGRPVIDDAGFANMRVRRNDCLRQHLRSSAQHCARIYRCLRVDDARNSKTSRSETPLYLDPMPPAGTANGDQSEHIRELRLAVRPSLKSFVANVHGHTGKCRRHLAVVEQRDHPALEQSDDTGQHLRMARAAPNCIAL
ncbi:hypothetical protein RT97_18650 [Variovorax paradoxus]|uniref:Uncharacterized protein n=1 Tax=Variovorax paradoxus TaxID=34073 RepID=A0A0D0MB68_VARPD|nr:hypothetical protein RT97_18650 [Variovorax paradoxus]